jgi:hypothetical protein
MYEHKSQRLAPRHVFYRRILNNALISAVVLGIALAIGIIGYHYTSNIPWIDSLHNASMILSGMGPVIEIKTVSGKWFSSIYALFSGVVFITNIGYLMTPIVHRFFHKLHAEEK